MSPQGAPGCQPPAPLLLLLPLLMAFVALREVQQHHTGMGMSNGSHDLASQAQGFRLSPKRQPRHHQSGVQPSLPPPRDEMMRFSLNLSCQINIRSISTSSCDNGWWNQPAKDRATRLRMQRVIPAHGDHLPLANSKTKAPQTKGHKTVFAIHPSAAPKPLDSCCPICTVTVNQLPALPSSASARHHQEVSVLIKHFPNCYSSSHNF